MDLFADLRSPMVVLSALPWVLLFAWVARRLVGARRTTLRVTMVSGVIGYALGLGIAAALFGEMQSAAFVGTATGFAIAFIMVALVALELIAIEHPSALTAPAPPRLPRPIRALRRRFEVTRRSLQVTRIAARHGLGGLLGIGYGSHRGEDAIQVARRARLALEEAGGMFIKLGQLLSTRVDLIPLSAAQELARLQERAAPAPADAVRRVLEDELDRPVDEVFAAIDWEPLAAASLGQVYAAQLVTGEDVVIKVQRPGISDVVDRDLAIVRRLARLTESRTAWGRSLGVIAIADEFAERLLEELDYRVEATNAAEIASALKHLPEIHVHDVWDELSTSRLLVMERLRGTSVGDLTAADATDLADRERLADTLLRAALEPMLAGERFHADPHPGNVFLLDDGRIGLLDFGAAGRLDAFERSSIATMLSAIKDGDPTLLREAVIEVTGPDRDTDVYDLDRALARFMARHLGGGRAPDAAALNTLLTVFTSHGIALPASTTTMFRALVTLEGTLSTLVPGYRVVEAGERLGGQLAREQLDPSTLRDRARDELLKLTPLLQRAPRHLDRIATLVERGEIRTRVSLFAEREDAALVTRLVNRGVLALIGSTLGVVSALLLGIEGGPTLGATVDLLDVLGYAGLAAGAILILRVVLSTAVDHGVTPGTVRPGSRR